MGTTKFGGPVYGAKSLLFLAHKNAVAAGVTDQEVYQIDVPADEDWLLTNVATYCDIIGNSGTVDIEDDGSSVLSAAITLIADDSVETAITATAGEDEGKLVAAGSTVTVDVTNGATTEVEDLTVAVYGFIRKRPHVHHGY